MKSHTTVKSNFSPNFFDNMIMKRSSNEREEEECKEAAISLVSGVNFISPRVNLPVQVGIAQEAKGVGMLKFDAAERA